MRFESEQDFPNPPQSTNTRTQSTLDFFQPNRADEWTEGFPKSQNGHDKYYQDLPGTFVGMATTLSPYERIQGLGEPQIFSNGQDPFEISSSNQPFQQQRISYPFPYSEAPSGNSQIIPSRSALATQQAFQSFYGTSGNPYNNTSPIAENGSHPFPTPPQSSHVPEFFHSNDFGGFSRAAPIPRPLRFGSDIRFGSDVRFEGPGFMAPPDQESDEALFRRRKAHLECLKPEPSPASTHPSSPVQQKRNQTQLQHPGYATGLAQRPLIQSPSTSQKFNVHAQLDQTPRKRRKADFDDDSDYEDPSTPVNPRSKRTKVSSSPNITPMRQDSTSTSRGSNARSRQASIKNSRQCLSEEQKKHNHIISEQKRRDLIKKGYTGIQHLVPSLTGTKTSKGNILESAADWLEDIVDCNRALRQQLEYMKGGGT